MSNEKNLGWLGYIGDYTTQLYFFFLMARSSVLLRPLAVNSSELTIVNSAQLYRAL